MNRIRTLNVALVIHVFIIMTSSAFLSGFCLHVLYKYKIISDLRVTPTVLSVVALVVSTIIGTVLTFVIADRLLKPLNELIVATREVAKGNYNIKVTNVNDDNELGELIRSFNHMTQELNGIEMFRKDFINTFSHEFRTPIVSIRGFARQLQKDSLTDDQRQEYTDIIISESERLTKMSSNILLLTKLEHLAIVTDKKSFLLDEQIRNCILLLQMQWEKKNIDFQIEMDAISYYSNEEMLSQVWLNLLSNAIKFSHPNGVISVQCYDDGTDVKVKIADKGIGMDDLTMQQIFEKFYQGDSAHASEGNGLGLSLVRRIIDLCGGKIVVKSQLGKGTTFIVRLPKQPEA